MAESWYERASRFERDLWDNEMVAFPQNVSFRGDVRHPDGSKLTKNELDLLKWIVVPVCSATQEIVLPALQRFKVSTPTVSPKTIINFGGMPNAAARVLGSGELEIHLGPPFYVLVPVRYVRTDKEHGCS